jgi:hypothetical protein
MSSSETLSEQVRRKRKMLEQESQSAASAAGATGAEPSLAFNPPPRHSVPLLNPPDALPCRPGVPGAGTTDSPWTSAYDINEMNGWYRNESQAPQKRGISTSSSSSATASATGCCHSSSSGNTADVEYDYGTIRSYS